MAEVASPFISQWIRSTCSWTFGEMVQVTWSIARGETATKPHTRWNACLPVRSSFHQTSVSCFVGCVELLNVFNEAPSLFVFLHPNVTWGSQGKRREEITSIKSVELSNSKQNTFLMLFLGIVLLFRPTKGPHCDL